MTRIEFTTADLPGEPPAQDPGPANDNAVAQGQQQQQALAAKMAILSEAGASGAGTHARQNDHFGSTGGAPC